MTKEIVKTPNNIVKGTIEIDAQINKLYYRILKNIQQQNRDLIVEHKKGEKPTEEQQAKLEKLQATPYLKCKISKAQIFEIVKRKNEQTSDEILKKFHALQTAIFRFSTGESNVQTQLIGTVEENDDSYTVYVDTSLYKYLLYYVEVGYTPINLAVLFNLRSPHAQNLYLALRKWSGTKKEITFTIEEIREILNCQNKYKAYKSLKQSAITPAMDGINKTGSMEILEMKEDKKGTRAVQAVTFVVRDLEERVVRKKEIPAPKKLEPVLWLDTVKVADKKLIVAIEALIGDVCYDSPIVRGIIEKAYATTIAKDKNGEEMITALNMGLFTTIVNGAFESNELGALNSVSEYDENSYSEAELFGCPADYEEAQDADYEDVYNDDLAEILKSRGY